MFDTKVRWGVRPYAALLLLLVLGSRLVIGRPQEGQPLRAASSVEQTVMRFSPEQQLERSVESAASRANMFPYYPPSAIAGGEQDKTRARDTAEDPDGNEIPSVDVNADWSGEEEADSVENQPGLWFADLVAALLPRGSPRHDEAGEPLPDEEPGLRKDVPEIVEEDVDVDRPAVKFSPPQGARQHGDARLASSRPQRVHDRAPQPSGVGASGASNVAMPDSVHGLIDEVMFWQDLMETDVDADRPIDLSVIDPPGRPHPEAPPREDEEDPPQDSDSWDSGLWTDITDLDMGRDGYPFDDDMEDEEEEYVDDVPFGLAFQVIQAMQAKPAWMDTAEADSRDEPDWGNREEAESREEDGIDIDWVPFGNGNPKGSRLIALIFQTITVPINVLDKIERDDEQGLLNKDVDIWQILNNFPFQMLLGNNFDSSDDDADEFNEMYEDEDYDDDDYDDDDDDDDEDDGMILLKYDHVFIDDEKYLKPEKENESEEYDDFDYSDEYDTVYEDCDEGDCSEEDEEATADDFTVISMPPMVTKK